MKYFTPGYFRFFDLLAINNNKEWFDKNRETYENEVKAPFRKLVVDITERLAEDFPEINRNPAKATFRINRDIRFSKDKSPYKIHLAAAFTRTGTQDVDYPGFYIQFGAGEMMVGGGKYFCSKEDIACIRQEIYYNNDEFKQIYTHPDFRLCFGSIAGERNKILPAPYDEFHRQQQYIANKQFWYAARFTRRDATGIHLLTKILTHFKAGYALNRFLLRAIQND